MLIIEARSIDRFMRIAHADVVTAAIAAGLSAVTILSFSGIDFAIKTRGVVLAIFAVMFSAGGWWTARTWNKLWRSGRSDWEHLVYDNGVRGMGYLMAALIFITVTWLGWAADSGPLFGPLMIGGALASIFFGVPVALHFGSIWGRMTALIFGVERDARIEQGEPPRLSLSSDRCDP
jgi:hypothetical protein